MLGLIEETLRRCPLHLDGSEVVLDGRKTPERLTLDGCLHIVEWSLYVGRFSFIFRQTRLYTFGTLDSEFRCAEEDLRPSDHISNDSESFCRQEMIADFIEISKHITRI